eukprot:CAMPEP_0184656124 /NCGR_PEP_ID=MMETSP0308-20130426/15671_1 /TAXON_ID=38269 /ORGANISM="Gloeochaete witrockiana, Strain SAG 46.84" /LENGTH=389 /DNA_ID=CAMNT_0027093069 /DNA_START=209 /DNA_END=1378 /DNA_ORIENTATION=+
MVDLEALKVNLAEQEFSKSHENTDSEYESAGEDFEDDCFALPETSLVVVLEEEFDSCRPAIERVNGKKVYTAEMMREIGKLVPKEGSPIVLSAKKSRRSRRGGRRSRRGREKAQEVSLTAEGAIPSLAMPNTASSDDDELSLSSSSTAVTPCASARPSPAPLGIPVMSLRQPSPSPMTTSAPFRNSSPSPMTSQAPFRKPSPSPMTSAPVTKSSPSPTTTEAPYRKPSPSRMTSPMTSPVPTPVFRRSSPSPVTPSLRTSPNQMARASPEPLDISTLPAKVIHPVAEKPGSSYDFRNFASSGKRRKDGNRHAKIPESSSQSPVQNDATDGIMESTSKCSRKPPSGRKANINGRGDNSANQGLQRTSSFEAWLFRRQTSILPMTQPLGAA